MKKIYVIICIVLGLTLSSLGQSQKIPFELKDFSGGLNTFSSPSEVAPNEAIQCWNVSWTRDKTLVKRGGFTSYYKDTILAGVDGLWKYYKGDSSYLLMGIDTALWRVTSASAKYKLQGQLGTAGKFYFANINSKVFSAKESFRPYYYDGTQTFQCGRADTGVVDSIYGSTNSCTVYVRMNDKGWIQDQWAGYTFRYFDPYDIPSDSSDKTGTANGSDTAWLYSGCSGGGSQWQCLSATGGGYIYATPTQLSNDQGVKNPAWAGVSYIIDSIKVMTYGKGSTSSPHYKIWVKAGATKYLSDSKSVTTNYIWINYTWQNNPYYSRRWLSSEIANLEFGVDAFDVENVPPPETVFVDAMKVRIYYRLLPITYGNKYSGYGFIQANSYNTLKIQRRLLTGTNFGAWHTGIDAKGYIFSWFSDSAVYDSNQVATVTGGGATCEYDIVTVDAMDSGFCLNQPYVINIYEGRSRTFEDYIRNNTATHLFTRAIATDSLTGDSKFTIFKKEFWDFKFTTVYKNCLFGTVGDSIFWSTPSNENDFPPENSDVIPDKITGMATFFNDQLGYRDNPTDVLFIFCQNSIWIYEGEYDNFRRYQIVSGVGCIAPQSITNILGKMIVFADYSGVWGLTSREPIYLSQKVKSFFTDSIPRTSMPYMVGGYYDRHFYLSYPRSGTVCNRTLIFNIDNDSWALANFGFSASFNPYSSGDTCNFILGSPTKGQIFYFNESFKDTAVSFIMKYQTGWFTLPGNQWKRLEDCYLEFNKGYGNLKVRLYKDYSTTPTDSVTITDTGQKIKYLNFSGEFKAENAWSVEFESSSDTCEIIKFFGNIVPAGKLR